MGPQRDYKERDRKETTKNGPVKKLQRTGPQRDYKGHARKNRECTEKLGRDS